MAIRSSTIKINYTEVLRNIERPMLDKIARSPIKILARWTFQEPANFFQIGVGTPNPSRGLHVVGAAEEDAQILIEATGNQLTGIEFIHNPATVNVFTAGDARMFLFVEHGALYWRGWGGTVTEVAPS